MSETTAFVGLDVHKETVSVAIADAGCLGEVRHLGDIENTPTAIARLARRISRRHEAIEFVYEAGSLRLQCSAVVPRLRVIPYAAQVRRPSQEQRT
jgi:hypothetical protein